MRGRRIARRRASTRLVPGVALLEDRLLLSSDVLTYHGDSARSGWDSSETTLSPADVNSSSFGKLYNMPVDGRVDAQPLYVAGVDIPGQGVHDVVYIATENDSLYAFDADSGLRLWRISLLPAGEALYDRPQGAPGGLVGIMATPVIDAATGTMYLVAASQSTSGGTTTVHQRLHALSIATGADVVPARSIDQSITYPGPGPGGNGTDVIFNPGQYKERDALLLENGVVYTSWSSNYDAAPYTGWVIGFKASDLGLASVLNIDPAGQPTSSFLDDGSGNSFWNSGDGPAADAQGNLYNISANGPFDPTLNAAGFPANGDYGDSFLKITPSAGALTVTDYFTPANQQLLANGDLDLGSSGIALADEPGPGGTIEHLAIGSDKQGDVFVVNRDAMGKFHASGDAVLQELPGALGGGEFGTPVVFGGNVYFGAVGEPIRMFWFEGGVLVPVDGTANSFGYPGATPTVSSDGIADGILWATEDTPNAVLHAYLAADPSVELYNSDMAPDGRDWFGAGNKFIAPVVADGKVFVATTTGVAEFGLRLTPPPIFTQPPRAASNPVAGNSVALSTLTTDASYPGSALTYTWVTLTNPPGTATPTFSANFTNASKSTVATVYGPGTYIFLVVVTDPSGTQTNCMTLVNFVAPAPVKSVAAALPSTGAATHPAVTTAPTTVNAGLALAPTITVATKTPVTDVTTTLVSNAVRIMLVPQELPDEAMSLLARPLGGHRSFARSVSRWWSD